LGRDYAGIRHLFYYPKSKSFIWCTHLEPLALCGDQFTLCDEYFASYLAAWPEAHLTPYREIHSVSPGEFVIVRNGRVSTHSYWTFHPELKTRYKTDTEYEEHFRDLFRQAVRHRLRTESSILADLSGGLDSSAVVCMADDILAKEGAETSSVDTFSILALDEPGEEDSLYLSKVEERRGRIGHHAVIQQLSTSPFEFANFVATPIFAGRPEMNAAKSEVIKRGKYRVILSGSGGDEMLGQALDPQIQLADLLRQARFSELGRLLRAWSLLSRRPWIHLFLDAFLAQLPVSIRARTSKSAKVAPWVNGKFARRQRLAARQLDVAEGSWFWLPSVQDWFYTLLTLARGASKVLPSTEETRYPYRDQRLVEFLISIPTEQLLRPGQRRSLMRRALDGLLPPEILARVTKHGSDRYFSAALEKYWDKLETILRSPVISRLGYINRDQFHASLLDAKNGNIPRHCPQLIKALSWELWLREAIARDVVSVQFGVPVPLGGDLVQSRA
jgi:asparagine synthase (glutamine-hydrolysing)